MIYTIQKDRHQSPSAQKPKKPKNKHQGPKKKGKKKEEKAKTKRNISTPAGFEPALTNETDIGFINPPTYLSMWK